MKTKYQILIIGAGTGGIMTASQLRRKNKDLDIAIIDPKATHYYQPAWTLVGAGTYSYEKTGRPMSSLIPKGVAWIKEYVKELQPENNQVVLNSGAVLTYDFLIVSPGLVNDFSLIEGLEDALNKGVVCSNYVDPNYTWKSLQQFKGGTALFSQPATPIKCGGAPQKIMYLAADYFRKQHISSTIIFAVPSSVIFGVKKIAATLTKVIERYHIDFKPLHTPVKIDADKKVAYFKTEEGKELTAIPFDFMHLAPPQTAPDFIKKSVLANEAGWLEVDHHSLQNLKYKNIFGIGDVTALPTAKTGAAIRKQAPIVVENILQLVAGKTASNHSYQGYSSCPLVTGYGKMVLAEFNYKNEFTPDPMLKYMLISDSSKEHWRLWMMKKYMLPYLYWNKMMKGKEV